MSSHLSRLDKLKQWKDTQHNVQGTKKITNAATKKMTTSTIGVLTTRSANIANIPVTNNKRKAVDVNTKVE